MADVKLVGNDDSAFGSYEPKNYFYLQKFSANATGTLKSLRVKVTGSCNIKIAIYADSSGEPGSLLASAGATACTSGWNTINVSDVSITSGTNYWIGFDSDTLLYGVACVTNSSGKVVRSKSATYSTFTFPDPAGTGFSTTTSHDIGLAGWGEEPSSASWGGTWGG